MQNAARRAPDADAVDDDGVGRARPGRAQFALALALARRDTHQVKKDPEFHKE